MTHPKPYRRACRIITAKRAPYWSCFAGRNWSLSLMVPARPPKYIKTYGISLCMNRHVVRAADSQSGQIGQYGLLTDRPVSGPGCRRAVVVVQGDALNRSRISTVVCLPLTSNVRWEDAPGNVLLPLRLTGLVQD